jgi:hypothetical protein
MLRGLTVLHQHKGSGFPGALPPVPTSSGPTLILDTCQRWICVLRTQEPITPIPGVDQFSGEDAYRFLLRVTTGLESRLQGETNIFGQVKQAWAPHGTHFPWLQRLFEDTKEIRAQHLSDVGGPSYGRLVRRLLHPISAPHGRSLLLVGAGELAQAVAPWLTGFHLHILNRDATRAATLAQSLRHHGHHHLPIDVVVASDIDDAWRSAHAVVLCIPFDTDQDRRRIAQLQQRSGAFPRPLVIHLGGTHSQAGPWTQVPNFHSLDDVFLLHQHESGARRSQLRRADHACQERARLRALGPSLSISHGWEDLASFAAWETEVADGHDTGSETQYTGFVTTDLALT